MDEKIKPGVYILAAIISAVAVIIAAILSHDKVIEVFLRAVGTKTIKIHASPDFSGASIYLAGDDMLTFAEANRIAGVGDTETDQLTKSFFSFYLGDVPPDADISEAEIRILCDVVGSPEPLGRLVLREYGFGTYSQLAFYGAPSGNWGVGWRETDKAVAACKYSNHLLVSGNSLVDIVQQRLSARWIQFVFYFEGDLIIPNQSIDAIVLTDTPVLTLKYYVEP